jgi:hypothetical protein
MLANRKKSQFAIAETVVGTIQPIEGVSIPPTTTNEAIAALSSLAIPEDTISSTIPDDTTATLSPTMPNQSTAPHPSTAPNGVNGPKLVVGAIVTVEGVSERVGGRRKLVIGAIVVVEGVSGRVVRRSERLKGNGKMGSGTSVVELKPTPARRRDGGIRKGGVKPDAVDEPVVSFLDLTL